MRLRGFKTVLWFLAGAGLLVVLLRIIHGLGAVVALNDVLPWGLWKGGGVVALVPIGGAGFTVAAMVYIFHWKRYEPVARGAVLLGLCCYGSVAVGLTFDIGIWWRIVFPLVFWQFHSTLFEIAWCIMLYLGVLTVEFSHAVLERLNFPRLLKVVEKASIVFVILGICLSTLHQSSLGTLFLATPYRLHPLWYSALLPVMFLITAIGIGCLTIGWVTLLVHWLYDREAPMKALSGLARISTLVLGVYGVLRFGDLLLTGKGADLLSSGWNSANFWIEIILSVAIPVVLLSLRRFRESPAALFWISTAAVVGISLNRVNVAGLATMSFAEGSYLPIWPEWAVTLGVLSAAGLFFLFCVERFDVFAGIDKEAVARATGSGSVDRADWRTTFFHLPLGDARLYSLVVVLALGVAACLLPDSAIYGVQPTVTPVRGPRVVSIQKVATGNDRRFIFPVDTKAHPVAPPVKALLIDGDDNGRYVLFDHDHHAKVVKDRGKTCNECHHMNRPLAEATSCQQCHADMHLPRDVFDHTTHTQHLGGNQGCIKCHTDPSAPKVRANVTPCESCHPQMRRESTLVKHRAQTDPQRDQAPGYKEAMHKLCITCHKREEKRQRMAQPELSGCTRCHGDTPKISQLVSEATPAPSEGGK